MDAAEELFDQHLPLLRKVILVHQRIPACDADDIVQLVRIDFFRYLPRIHAPAGFLARAAASLCRTYVRTQRRERDGLEELAREKPPATRALSRHEEALIGRLDVRAALGRVGKKCAEMIRSVVLRQRTQAEYARAASIPLGSMGPSVLRCLTKIKRTLCSYEER